MRQKTNPLDFIAGGNEKEFIRYFDFAQKLIPVKILLAQGNLYGAIDKYRIALRSDLSNQFIEEFMFKKCNLAAKKAQSEQGWGAMEEVWEKCGTMFEKSLLDETNQK